MTVDQLVENKHIDDFPKQKAVLIVSDEKPGSKSLAEAFKKGNLAKKF
jgi:hypothetical protein